MTKVTYKRKPLTGGLLTLSVGESMTSSVGLRTEADRHGVGVIAESSHLTHKHVAERVRDWA